MAKLKKDLYYFDELAADRVITFIERHITHVKGELTSKTFILEEWQKDDIIKTTIWDEV